MLYGNLNYGDKNIMQIHKNNAFDITVGQETRTITHENNQAVFKLSESKNYNIEICKKSCKSNHSFSNI